MNFSSRFNVAFGLMGTVVIPLVQVQVAIAAIPPEVTNIALKVTVRIDGANTGSGVIIDRQGNTYTILTNWHVIEKVGNYTIQTDDHKTHQINRSAIKHIGNVDLAEVQFTSQGNYQKVDLYYSQINSGATVYIPGWADPDAVSTAREYVILPQTITRVVQNPKDEYTLVFNNPTKPGMSGGPVLDEQGRLVGIHGQSRLDTRTEATDFLGIPIKIYLNFASATGVRLQRQAASSSQRENTTLPNQRVGKPSEQSNNSRQSQVTNADTNPSPPTLSSNALAYLKRGTERWDNGDERGAIEDFRQVQQLDPSAANEKGLALAADAAENTQLREYKQALPQARVASILAPNNYKVWLLLGSLYLETQKLDNSIAALQKAQSLNPNNGDVQLALGLANFQQQKYQKAVEYFQASLKLKPDNPKGLFYLGNTYHALGRLPEAIAQYNKAISNDKELWAAASKIGLILYEQGNVQGAIKQWQAATAIAREALEPKLALAVALYNAEHGDYREIHRTAYDVFINIDIRDRRFIDLNFLKQNLWGNRLLADTKKFLEKRQCFFTPGADCWHTVNHHSNPN